MSYVEQRGSSGDGLHEFLLCNNPGYAALRAPAGAASEQPSDLAVPAGAVAEANVPWSAPREAGAAPTAAPARGDAPPPPYSDAEIERRVMAAIEKAKASGVGDPLAAGAAESERLVQANRRGVRLEDQDASLSSVTRCEQSETDRADGRERAEASAASPPNLAEPPLGPTRQAGASSEQAAPGTGDASAAGRRRNDATAWRTAATPASASERVARCSGVSSAVGGGAGTPTQRRSNGEADQSRQRESTRADEQRSSGTTAPRNAQQRRRKPPASPRQIAANRANALHSTGPTSEFGKRRAARNPTTHGANAGPDAIPPDCGWVREDPEQVADFIRSIVEALAPLNRACEAAARDVAHAMLNGQRLNRSTEEIIRFETSRLGGRVRDDIDDLREAAEATLEAVAHGRDWLADVDTLCSARRNSLAWRTVVVPCLRPHQAEELVRLFDDAMTEKVTFPPEWTDDEEPGTESGWRKVLRNYLVRVFQGDLTAVSDWFERAAYAAETALGEARRRERGEARRAPIAKRTPWSVLSTASSTSLHAPTVVWPARCNGSETFKRSRRARQAKTRSEEKRETNNLSG